MKKLKEIFNTDFKQYYKEFKKALEKDTYHKPSLYKRHSRYYDKKNQELITGAVIFFLVIIIICSVSYYFLILSPSMEELEEHKNMKINELNSIFNDNLTTNPTKQAILSRINKSSSVEEVDNIDIESEVYPILKSQLLNDISEYKDKFNRVELKINDTSSIMEADNATKYIESQTTTLKDISIAQVDSVIIPLTISRKQAASGLISEGDVVDIYKTTISDESIQQTNQSNESLNNTDINETSVNETSNVTTQSTSKLVGGSEIVSILRSKDSGSVDSDIELTSSNNLTNTSQSSSLDIEEVLSSKSAGTYNQSQIKILLDKYGWRLSNYERTSNIGDLDVEYMIMLEVPRDSVEKVISNMDDLILTIPTYDAPSWVNLTK